MTADVKQLAHDARSLARRTFWFLLRIFCPGETFYGLLVARADHTFASMVC